MINLKQLVSPPGTQALLLGFALLPVGCLLWQWNALPSQIPLHFSRGGADTFGSKEVAIGLALMPLLLYVTLVFAYPVANEKPAQRQKRQIIFGAIVFLSLMLCVWLLAGITISR